MPMVVWETMEGKTLWRGQRLADDAAMTIRKKSNVEVISASTWIDVSSETGWYFDLIHVHDGEVEDEFELCIWEID